MEVFSHCLNPQKIFNRYTRHWEIVPCGECYACKNKSASVITKRVEKEIRSHKFSYMFTLTYSNEFIPRMELLQDKKGTYQIRPTGRLADFYKSTPLFYSDDDKFRHKSDKIKVESLDNSFIPHIEQDDVIGEFGVCSKRDIQLFFKRLRKRIHEIEKNTGESMPIRYFIASEYGPRTLRPHYHGILFFDSEKLTHFIQGTIVKSWGLSQRLPGKANKSRFRPFADINRTIGYIKPCDPNTAYYVADYVSSNDNLPTVLQHPLTRPFRLGSQSPLIGSFKDLRQEMLQDVAGGVATHVIERIDKTAQCVEYVDIPYSKGDISSVFLKCKEFYALSSATKSAIYSFAYDRYDEWLEWITPIAMGSGNSSPNCFLRTNRDYSLRCYCKKFYSHLYYYLHFDDDSFWYASNRANNMIRKYDIFSSLGFASPVDGYLYMFHRAYSILENYKLKHFHQNLQQWIDYVGNDSIVAAYPFLIENLPASYDEFRLSDDSYHNLVKSYHLEKKLYKGGLLDYDYLRSVSESEYQNYKCYQVDQKRRYFDRSKQKKANNSIYMGVRKID